MTNLPNAIPEFLEAAASGAPVPGGGSVSALAGSLGVSMAIMAANFTIGKKNFKEVEEDVRKIKYELHPCMNTLYQLMLADADAYHHVSDAYGMPKESAEEKTLRSDAIQRALAIALEPPRQGVQTVGQALGYIRRLAPMANPQLISDVGVSANLLIGALRGLLLNVDININTLKDTAKADTIRREMVETSRHAEDDAADILSVVREKMNPKKVEKK